MYISLESIWRKFDSDWVIKELSIKFESGKISSIYAPNGSGKSTLANLIIGFLKPNKGEIVFSDDINHKDISLLYGGERNLYMKNTVKENIYYFATLKGLDKQETLKNIKEYSKTFPIYYEIENKLCETLSHGQKRLSAILANLVCNPKCLILDEAIEGLDEDHVIKLKTLLKSYKKDRIVILISHDLEFLKSISDEILYLKDY